MSPSFVSFPLFLYFFGFCEDRQEKEKSGEIAFALLMFHREGIFAGPTISILVTST